MNTPRRPARPSNAALDSATSRSEESSDRSMTFEQLLAALERIVEELEHGDLGLSDTLARYEQGIRHLRECYGQLESAERRVELLKQIDTRGRAVTEPFADESMTLEEKAAARGSRRSAPISQASSPDAAADDTDDARGEDVDDSTSLF